MRQWKWWKRRVADYCYGQPVSKICRVVRLLWKSVAVVFHGSVTFAEWVAVSVLLVVNGQAGQRVDERHSGETDGEFRQACGSQTG